MQLGTEHRSSSYFVITSYQVSRPIIGHMVEYYEYLQSRHLVDVTSTAGELLSTLVITHVTLSAALAES